MFDGCRLFDGREKSERSCIPFDPDIIVNNCKWLRAAMNRYKQQWENCFDRR